MGTFVVVFLLGLIIGAIWMGIPNRRTQVSQAFLARKPLSEPEQALYWRLREAVPECVVLSQVTFSRFMAPQGETDWERRALLNRIAQKTADFLVCLPDFTVVAVVELDDSTHHAGRDARRDALVESAGLPVVRVHVRDLPSVDALRAMFTR